MVVSTEVTTVFEERFKFTASIWRFEMMRCTLDELGGSSGYNYTLAKCSIVWIDADAKNRFRDDILTGGDNLEIGSRFIVVLSYIYELLT